MYSKSTKPERLASRPAKTGLREAIPLPDTQKPVNTDNTNQGILLLHLVCQVSQVFPMSPATIHWLLFV
jgi:hypothetical protein